jgi:hypothetical protein
MCTHKWIKAHPHVLQFLNGVVGVEGMLYDPRGQLEFTIAWNITHLKNNQAEAYALFQGVGTGADPGFNVLTAHQQNPNYWPFWQHLRRR